MKGRVYLVISLLNDKCAIFCGATFDMWYSQMRCLEVMTCYHTLGQDLIVDEVRWGRCQAGTAVHLCFLFVTGYTMYFVFRKGFVRTRQRI